MNKFLVLSFFGFFQLFPFTHCFSQQHSYKIARVKYNGGGDWYCSRTALKNLTIFCNQEIKTNFAREEVVVEAGSPTIFSYPFAFLSGHGNIVFSESEAENLRNYLLGGGFLHIDDNYGLDKFIRPQMKRVFPNKEFVELPSSHPIFRQKFIFENGLPKIHEHDGKDLEQKLFLSMDALYACTLISVIWAMGGKIWGLILTIL